MLQYQACMIFGWVFTLLNVDTNRSDEGTFPFMTSCRQRCKSWIRDVSAMAGNVRGPGMYIARG